MKRAAGPGWLLDRSVPWLSWWQELILNWVASWRSVGSITVTQADGDDFTTWNLPTDLDMQRAELEELLQ